MRAEPGQRLRREVRIRHHGGGAVQHLGLRRQIVGRDVPGQGVVAERQLHIPVRAFNGQIGRGGRAGDADRVAQLDAEALAVLLHAAGVEIAAQRGEHAHRAVQQPQIVGNVPPNAAQGQLDRAGIGIPFDQRREGFAANIQIDSADDGDVRLHIEHPQSAL